MFSDQQKAMLGAPLNSSNVRKRDQGGRKVSYVEGWHVIAEANRIFGFDAWSRETVDINCVSEKEREIGQAKNPGYGVTYIARVRITVGEIVREGCGTGHGIDRDLGQAHESALKEAETDAMKRALMTFGNPFGLALYDKEQANVEKEPAQQEPVKRIAQSGKDVELATNIKKQINECRSVKEFDDLKGQPEFKRAFNVLPEGLQDDILRHGKSKRAALDTPHMMAG